MYVHTLTNEVIRANVIEIMKSKGQYDQAKTNINVQKFTLDKCDIFLIEVNQISSTMILSQNWPKQLLKTGDTPSIFAFRADIQTNGRGQRENIWMSPLGNLYLTLLIKIQLTFFPYLPMIAVGNVLKVIKTYLNQANSESITKIKWINDIMVDFQKVSGVLIKNQMIGQSFFTQIGIGVNIKQLPESLLESIPQAATFLEKHTQTNISVKEFALNLIQFFVDTLFTTAAEKVKSQSQSFYESNLAYLKKDVLIYDNKYEKILGEGRFEGINEYGYAILEGTDKPFGEGRMKVHHSAF